MGTQTLTVDAPALELDDLQSRSQNDLNIELAPKANEEEKTLASTGPSVVTVEPPKLSTRKAWITILQLCGNAFINSFGAGVLIVCLPVISTDLDLPRNLLLWPTSVTSLASASCQLIAGSVADVLGPKTPNSVGSFLQSVLIIATGFAADAYQLIIFRALLGVASSIFTTSARAILSRNIERGRLRNFAFAAIVLSFPLGAGLGLVLGGIYAEKSSWRIAYWSSGAVGLLLSISGVFTLPSGPGKHVSWSEVRRRLATEIDWVGAIIASTALALLSYVFALLSASTEYIHRPVNAVLLATSLALIPAFAMWMQRREKKGLPALIPNSL
ncbi:hypothetical protein DOTSEDRAFT_35913 [Dothistroma septosporum NZE10]|uniref:Major facilitator superfamily (MFS) profile domain-containing protein n=1 Tax=Dothistroma septosporum (strain NZE10 / CBS 128990) TaxID=675120 RepID=M2Y628_DOTSN|nr:hypothetical protein DOTSEDRAFT_35913 [Dothistroma septosporum NZE10]